jgi:WD40 repeat protein
MPYAGLCYCCSGSDGTARLWSIGAVSGGSTPFGSQKSVVLAHDIRNDGSRDISALDWASDGGMVATADVDGSVRLWSKEGKVCIQHDMLSS